MIIWRKDARRRWQAMLPDHDKAVLRLWLEGASLECIATELQLTPEQAREAINRVRAQLWGRDRFESRAESPKTPSPRTE